MQVSWLLIYILKLTHQLGFIGNEELQGSNSGDNTDEIVKQNNAWKISGCANGLCRIWGVGHQQR